MAKTEELRKTEMEFCNFVSKRFKEVMENPKAKKILYKNPEKMFLTAYMFGMFDSIRVHSKIDKEIPSLV